MIQNLNSLDLLHKNKYTKKEYVTDMILSIVLLSVICFMLFTVTFWIDTREINGSSMCNTFKSGEVVVIDKLAQPKYLDVVVFQSKKDDPNSDDYIKRIIGIPGDYVYSINGYVYIDRLIDGEYKTIQVPDDYIPKKGITNISTKTYVTESCYFVLGDNREVSLDSRYAQVGLVSRQQIAGVVTEFWIKNKNITTFFFKKVLKK